MDTQRYDSAGPASSPPPGRRAQARRVVTTVAASALLLGGGAAIGIVVTGGASAATGQHAAATASGLARQRCTELAARLKSNAHPVAARRVAALCTHPLLRLAAVGGTHGEVTFAGKKGTRTIAFERGTVASVTGTSLTVTARDGTRWTWDVRPATAIRSAGHKVTGSSLSPGDPVFVDGTVTGGTRDAGLIRIGKSAS